MIATVLWRAVKVASVLSAVGVLALLVFSPELGLFITWSVLVPAVPALLLIAPQVWRNLCPIAVVHQLPSALGRAGTRRLRPRARTAAPIVAAVLLFAIVPLRPAALNQNGPALALFVITILAVALVGGALYAGKSGWCATWCPVLPVERLYGQNPLLPVAHAHCTSCAACVRSCYDLRPRHSFDALLGRTGQASLLRTPTGVFAAGFPGFVLGYFTRPATAGLGATYLWIGAFVLAAMLTFATTQRAGRLQPHTLARTAAALAAAAYYWFAVPETAHAAHALLDIPPAPSAGINIARTFFLLLAATWLVTSIRAGRHAPARPTGP